MTIGRTDEEAGSRLRAFVVALVATSGAAYSTGAASAQDSVPGSIDAGLSDAMRAALGGIDPLRAGWGSEVRARIAARDLARLGAFARSACAAGEPSEPNGGATDLGLSESFSTSGLVPSEWTVVFDDGGYTVRRGVPDERRGSERRRARAGLEASLTELARVWTSLESFDLEVIAIDDSPNGFRTTVRFHGTGEARVEEHAFELERSSTWYVEWRARADGEFALDRIDCGSHEEVRVRSHPYREAREVLSALAGFDVLERGEYALDYGWSSGMSELRARHDVRLGLPILGAPAGIAVGDVNDDGIDDLYLCQPGGLPNRLLLGNGGEFEDRSAGSGADFLDFSRSALLIDLGGTPATDLVVSVGTDLIFMEGDGTGRFTRRAVLSAPETTMLVAADYDLDGDLDIYACVYLTPYGGGGLPVPYHDAENGPQNFLFENRGDWTFVDVAAERGLDATRFSLAAAWEDYDLDGDPDLYVANDFGRNNLYRNDGGQFVDVASEAGVEDISAGMGVTWGDYDGDGLFDLYVSNMYSAAGNRVAYRRQFHSDSGPDVRAALQRHARGNTLFRNRGDGTFEDVSESAGVSLGRWAWGARFVDLNADGRLDLLVPNGLLSQSGGDDL